MLILLQQELMMMGLYKSKRNVLLHDAIRFDSPDETLVPLVITINKRNLDGISCANIADYLFENIYKILDADDSEYGLVIVDFQNVVNIGAPFLRKYIKYCLTTKFKVLDINMSLSAQQLYSEIVASSFDFSNVNNV